MGMAGGRKYRDGYGTMRKEKMACLTDCSVKKNKKTVNYVHVHNWPIKKLVVTVKIHTHGCNSSFEHTFGLPQRREQTHRCVSDLKSASVGFQSRAQAFHVTTIGGANLSMHY